MSRLAKVKAANLRAKKIRNAPVLGQQQAREAMAQRTFREWRKANPARPMYAMLDDMVVHCGLMVAALSFFNDRAGQAQS